MSEVQHLNNLIQVGMTREQFFAKYKEISDEIKNEPVKSIFLAGMDDTVVARMFDSIVIANDDGDTCDDAKISQSDYDKIAAYDGDASSISDEDLIKYYQEILQNTQMVSGPVDSDTPSLTYAQGLDMLHDLKLLKQQEAFDKKTKLQNEIDELIENDQSISKETKAKYKQLKSSKEQLTSLLEKKKREFEENKRNIQVTNAQVASKRAKADGIKDKTEKEDLEQTISGLQNNLSQYKTLSSKLSSEISDLTSDIQRLDSEMKKIIADIEKSGAETAKKIKEKQAEIENIDRVLTADLANIDAQIEQAEQQVVIEAQQAGTDSANYANAGNDGHIGKTAAQALSNAAGEIGVREATGHNDGAAIAKYRNGADNGAAWCASFVSWCYKGNDVFGYQASVSGIQMAAQRQGLYSEKGTYTPKPGDVMIQKNGCSHTGIVESVDPDGTIHTIEGNASNQVKRVTYRPGSKGYNHISGFVRMSERG